MKENGLSYELIRGLFPVFDTFGERLDAAFKQRSPGGNYFPCSSASIPHKWRMAFPHASAMPG